MTTMVMSMDATTTSDQVAATTTLGLSDSPMESASTSSSPFSPRQHESANEDDDQSKSSDRTVLIAGLAQQQSTSDSKQRFIQQTSIVPQDELKQGHQQEQCAAAMVVSRESSLDGERRLMMNVDDDDEQVGRSEHNVDTKSNMNDGQNSGANKSAENVDSPANILIITAHQQQQQQPQHMHHHGHASRSADVGTDTLVARMRDIVEGGRQHQSQHKSSSGESLNNQAESNSKESMDSAGQQTQQQVSHQHQHQPQQPQLQQKRSRHVRSAHHCNRHHHHHHHHHHQQHQQQHQQHHRSSVSAVAGRGAGHHHHHHHHTPASQQQQSQSQSQQQPQAQQPHPHHHHHHHRHISGQQAHSHHRHHYHHRHHHHAHGQHFASGSRTKLTHDGADDGKQVLAASDAAMSEPATGNEQQIGQQQQQPQHATIGQESKSSTSSVSSSAHNQRHHQHQPPPEATSATVGDEHNGGADDGKENDSEKKSTERCPIHHHHHHTSGQHPHHHHYHHRHHHHHHHKNNRKRMVLDSGADQTGEGEQQDQQAEVGDRENVEFGTGSQANGEPATGTAEDTAASNKAAPLQDITSQSGNVAPDTCCPYHEHQCAAHSRGHPRHHHHHHASGQNVDAKKQDDQQQQQQHKGHHHHHHHHHHRHHHHHHGHQHAAKQRHNRNRVGSSRTNLDQDQHDQMLLPDQNNLDNKSKLNDDIAADINRVESGDVNKKSYDEVEDKMHLDHDDNECSQKLHHHHHQQQQQQLRRPTRERVDIDLSIQQENNEVVKMEMSPSSDGGKPMSRLEMVEDCEHLVDSTASDSNLITSIEIISTPNKTSQQPPHHHHHQQQQQQQTLPNDLHKNKHQGLQHQQAKESDFGVQGVSGSEPSKRDSTRDEFGQGADFNGIKNGNDGDSGNNKHRGDQLVRQMSSSRENSKKSQSKEVDESGNQQDQYAIERSPMQADAQFSQQACQPKQIIESSVPADRRCRLCWCCCCPCSALSNRNTSNTTKSEPKTSPETQDSSGNKCQVLPNVSLEEIRTWGDSFDRLMKCSEGRKVFQDFLRCEYSEENILFWIACEELKSEKDAKNIAAKARDIYEDYISILSAKEVSLDSRVRDIINNNIKKPTSNIFDEAQLQIYTLMHRDSYPRFINSPMYKKLAQIQTTSRKSSS